MRVRVRRCVQEKPARVLAYQAAAVHQYGWIPLNPFKWRNVKATVFSSVLLNVQTAVLVGWAMLIHTTGLGMPEYDIRAFLKIWGTVYAGMSLLPLRSGSVQVSMHPSHRHWLLQGRFSTSQPWWSLF